MPDMPKRWENVNCPAVAYWQRQIAELGAAEMEPTMCTFCGAHPAIYCERCGEGLGHQAIKSYLRSAEVINSLRKGLGAENTAGKPDMINELGRVADLIAECDSPGIQGGWITFIQDVIQGRASEAR